MEENKEKIRSFKELYNNYINKKDIENESILLRTAIFDYNYYVIIKEDENKVILDTTKDEEGKVCLRVYTDLNQIDERINSNSQKMTLNFDSIVSTFHKHFFIDKLWINPETDNVKLTKMQLNDLMRQKNYNETYEPILIHEDIDFLKPAYKIKDFKFTNNKLIDIYKKYIEDNNPDTLSDFYKELTNNSKFLALVIPEENAEVDKNGNPLISRNRVMHYKLEDDTLTYLAYTSTSFIKDPTDDEYTSILDFDDYINLIDNYSDVKSMYIIGDIKLRIPIDDLNSIKIQKDRFKNDNAHINIESQYNDSSNEGKVLSENLKTYFSKIEEVEKVWLSLELDTSGMYKIFNIEIKGIKEIKNEMNDNIRKILQNALFRISIVNKENAKDTYKLIYDKN